jgi:hypothetical protein
VLKSDADDIFLGEVSANRSQAFPNLIRFIGLIEEKD